MSNAQPFEGARTEARQGGGSSSTTPALKEWPLWEVFVRS